MGGNKITDAGAASLSEALKHSNCQLTNLFLSGNQITDDGATSLSEALKQPSSQLKELKLSYNRITYARATSIIEVLKQSGCHVFVWDRPDLSDNYMTDEDAGAARREVFLIF